MTDVSLRIKVDSSETDKGKKSLDELAQAGAKAEGSGKQLTAQTDRLSTAAKAAAAAFTALVGSMAVRKVIEYADEWQNAENRLKLVTSSAEELTRVQGDLLGVANRTRAGFASTAELYTTLTRSTTALGLSSDELIGITKTINQTFQVAGASAAGMDGALRQLGQGLAAGALRGDEFNSVAEQAPGIMDALAASLKMGRGELREFAATGGITAEILVTALQEYSETAEKMAATATRTFGQSMTEARNNMVAFVGSSDAVKGATGVAGDAIVFLSRNIDVAAESALILAGVMTARMIPAMAASGAAYVAATAQSIAYQAALARMAGVSATAAAAQTALSGALALVGGPVGALIIAAGSIVYFVSKMESATESTARLRAELDSLNQEELQRGIEAQRTYNIALETRIARLAEQNMSVAANRERMAELRLELERGQKSLQELENGMRGIEERDFKKMLDEYFPPLVRFTSATDKATTATEELSAAIDENGIANYYAGIEAEKYWGWMQRIAIGQEAVAAATDTVTTRTTRLTEEQRNANLTNEDAAESIRGIVTGMTAQGEASQEVSRVMALMRDDVSSAFADMLMSGENAFDAIAKSFERMVYKMVADWAASKIMDTVGGFLGMSGGGGGAGGGGSGAGSILSGAASKAAGKIFGGGTGGTGGVTSAGVKSGLLTAGAGIAGGYAGTKLGESLFDKQAQSNIGAGIGATAGGIIGGPIGAAIGGAIGGSLDALFGADGTLSSNAGLLLHDVPGAKADQKFAVPAFDSGFAPVGFARREDQGAAVAVIDTLRGYDSALTALAESVGINVSLNNNTFRPMGSSETGRGDGVFVGLAAEDGKSKSASVQAQADEYVRLFVEGLGSQINPGAKSAILSAGSADAMLEKAAMLVHGSHANGLAYVPFDGYRAELHRGERVMPANEARAMDSGWGKMSSELSGMRAALMETAMATRRTADLLLRVTRDGESLVTVPA